MSERESYPAIVRNEGGRPALWVHADALEALGVEVMDELEAEIVDGELVIRPE